MTRHWNALMTSVPLSSASATIADRRLGSGMLWCRQVLLERLGHDHCQAIRRRLGSGMNCCRQVLLFAPRSRSLTGDTTVECSSAVKYLLFSEKDTTTGRRHGSKCIGVVKHFCASAAITARNSAAVCPVFVERFFSAFRPPSLHATRVGGDVVVLRRTLLEITLTARNDTPGKYAWSVSTLLARFCQIAISNGIGRGAWNEVRRTVHEPLQARRVVHIIGHSGVPAALRF